MGRTGTLKEMFDSFAKYGPFQPRVSTELTRNILISSIIDVRSEGWRYTHNEGISTESGIMLGWDFKE